ncbi:hypothetical protein [Paenochrobactrum pullorum]
MDFAFGGNLLNRLVTAQASSATVALNLSEKFRLVVICVSNR